MKNLELERLTNINRTKQEVLSRNSDIPVELRTLDITLLKTRIAELNQQLSNENTNHSVEQYRLGLRDAYKAMLYNTSKINNS